MFHPRWIIVIMLAVVCALAVSAQPEPAKDLCVVQGVVKFTDGTPFAGIAVSIQVDGKTIVPTPVTDDDGSYVAAAPAGPAILNVVGIAKQLKLEAGKQNVVDFAIVREGVILTVLNSDGQPMPGITPRAMIRTADNNPRDVAAVTIGPGRYWYRTLPAEAVGLSVIVTYSTTNNNGMMNGSPMYLRQQCALGKNQPMQQISVTCPRPVPVTLQVQDTDGKPLANAQVKGTLGINPPQKVTFWDDMPFTTYLSGVVAVDWRTDANGVVTLNNMLPRTYDLCLRSGAMAGPTTALDVKAGQPPLRYALNLKPRDVTQTLLGADGKPLPNAPVTLGYTWANVITYQQATADAKGVVTWKAVPPVNAIVWGPSLPVGILPADATHYAAPLQPLPATDPNNFNSRNVRVCLTDVGDKSTRVTYATLMSNSGNNVNEAQYRPDQINAENPFCVYLYADRRNPVPALSFIAMTRAIPPRMAVLNNMYLPPSDDNTDQDTLTLAFQSGSSLKGRLVTKNGPVKGLSQFRVVPVKINAGLGALLTPEFQRRAGLMQTNVNADGTFAVALPGSGTYRLVVDLYDENTTPLPELMVDVPEGGKELEVKLPEPMLTVPAGTLVSWLTQLSPASPRQVVAAAHANPTPIFAPRDQLLALWFRPAPDKLVVWNGLERQQTMLSLRAVTITVGEENGGNWGNRYTLLPLLPARNFRDFDFSGSAIPVAARAASDLFGTTVSADGAYCPSLWTGRYLIPGNSINNNMITHYIPVTVSADGPPEVAVTMKRPVRNVEATRYLTVRYSRNDFGQLRQGAADAILLAFDGESMFEATQTVSAFSLNPNSGNSIAVPVSAKTISLYWPGVGMIRNIALPAFVPNQQWVLELPAWDTLTTVSGAVLTADGKPFANRQLSTGVTLSNYQTTIRVQTDAAGAFTLKGVPPGPYYIFNDYDNRGCWTLDVPAKGLAGMTLKVSAQAMRVSGLAGGDIGSQLWWFPDGGQPVRLPVRNGDCALYDPPVGNGMLWSADGNRGDGSYQRFTMRAGDSYLNNDNGSQPTGPTLGLYFPLDLDAGSPGMVTLVGLEERANLRVRYRNIPWQATSLLNRVVAQINAVPPGKYKVIVETMNGPAESQVTVTDQGGKVEMTFPAPPVKPAPAP